MYPKSEAKKPATQNTPKKAPNIACSFYQKDKEGQPSMMENLDDNLFIRAKHLRKKSNPATCQQRPGGSLDFHTGMGVMRHLKAPAGGFRKDQIGSWGFHPSQAVTHSLQQQYQESPRGEPGPPLHLAVMRGPSLSLQE